MMITNGSDCFPAEPALPEGLGALLYFGGSFDPVHRAHVLLTDYAARQFGCEHILFVPANRSPHKMGDAGGGASGVDRYNMLKLAVGERGNVSVSDYEINRPAPSYTVNTLRRLRVCIGDGVKIYLLMGSDQALTFGSWYCAEEIVEMVRPCVVLRPPHKDWEELVGAGLDLNIFTNEMVVDAPLDDAASTVIRGEYGGEAGCDCSAFLHPAVREYIEAHHLYRADS